MKQLSYAAALAVAVMSMTGLAGCAPATETPGPRYAVKPGPTLHPEGAKTMWLNDGYANGLGDVWDPEGEICFVFPDEPLAVVSRGGHLAGVRIGTTEVVWQRDAAESCSEVWASDASALAPYLMTKASADISSAGSPNDTWTVIDMERGAELLTYTETRGGETSMIEPDTNRLYYTYAPDDGTGDDSLLDLSAISLDGTLLWRADLAPKTGECFRVMAVLACEGASGIRIIDSETGNVLSDVNATQAAAGGWWIWAVWPPSLTCHKSAEMCLRGASLRQALG